MISNAYIHYVHSVQHRALHHTVRVPGSADLHRTRRLMRLTHHARCASTYVRCDTYTGVLRPVVVSETLTVGTATDNYLLGTTGHVATHAVHGKVVLVL